MSYKLCMAEKPSVAKDIANVIGATKRENGYYEGNGYRVTWAVGHLVGLAEPESYGYVSQKDMYGEDKQTAYAQLPLIPKEFKLVVLEPTKAQFKIVKDLINDPECTEIINCGDMGPEGHILQWFIREKAGCKKKVRRFCATSMTDEAIRQAMNSLRPEEEFANIIKGEFCKKKADWIMGMSMSRVETIKHGTSINVGRVQSPTLYFVVKRYYEVKNFKVTNYFGMDADLAEGFHVFWTRDTDGTFPPALKDSEGRVLNEAAVKAKADEILRGGTGVIEELTKQKKSTDRPQLFDITELQREANRRYGYTAAVTLATAQALYETQKVLSYPRTDSRYITTDLKPYMVDRVKGLATIEKYKSAAETLLSSGLNIDKKIVDDSKVTDHHALIPTEKIHGFNPGAMSPTPEEKRKGVTAESMRNVLDLVLTRMILSMSSAYVYEQTSVKVRFANGMVFSAGGTKPLEMGWKGVQERLCGKEPASEDENAEDEQVFPALQKGQPVTVKDCAVTAKKTTPPKLHTEATLLTAMEKAGATIEGGEILKGKGIGTQATRAEIIKKLFDTGYCETLKKGKTNYIIPTQKGVMIIKALPKELYSPKITADWETRIAEIAAGRMTEEEFMRHFTAFIHAKVKEVKESETNIVFKKDRETFGKCPFCGKDVYRYQEKDEKTGKVKQTRFYCSESRNTGCPFSLKLDDPTVVTWTGKKLTEQQAIRMIAKGHILLDCTSKTGTGTYKGNFTFIKKEVGGKVYTNLQCERVKL